MSRHLTTTGAAVTRFEVAPDVDNMLQGLVGVTTNTPLATPSPHAITAVPWTVDPTLTPRQIRTHYSNGTSKVHDL